MRNYIPFAWCSMILFAVLTNSQTVSAEDYVQRRSEQGWVYHVFSARMPNAIKSAKPKNMDYDYTYVEHTDSVTILSTIDIDEKGKPVDVTISTCTDIYRYPLELIYADSRKKGFRCRLKCTIPFSTWENMYSCQTPFKISYRLGNQNDMKEYTFGFNDKKWQSGRWNIIKLQDAIKFNVKK